MTAAELPDSFEEYAAGEVVGLDADAVAVAARALAIWDGDGRAYDEDPETREGFAASARLVISVYVTQRTPV